MMWCSTQSFRGRIVRRLGAGLCMVAVAGLWVPAGLAEEPQVLIDGSVLPQPDQRPLDPAVILQKQQAAATSDAATPKEKSTAGAEPRHPPIAQAPSVHHGADKALPGCIGIDVRAANGQLFADSFESGNTEAWGQAEVVLSADRALDVLFDVYFDGTLVGDHVLHLKLTTPRGHHYQTLTAPITAGTSAVGGQRILQGYPFPVDVVAVQPVGPSSSSASLRLPVAGTPITTHGLYGRWTVEAFVDQAVEPCGDPGEFGLVP